MTRVLITGGAGFMGHHLVEHLLKNTDWEIVVLDRLNYASSGFDRLRDIDVFNGDRVLVFTADFTQPIVDGLAAEIGAIDYILHLGAETHVDNSIIDPHPFVQANVVGTMRMLDFARTLPNLKRFLYFSTDEVFGPAPEGTAYKEWDRYNSGNPYAATKAAGEELCLAYSNTYKLPVFITHTMNIFGERQHFEKFIPLVIRKMLKNEVITIHANKEKTKAGSRFYIHARNVAAAILFLLKNEKEAGMRCSKYNIVGEKEIDNLSLARFIYKQLIGSGVTFPEHEPLCEMVDFHSSRPGHDLRYALDGSKMKELGYTLPVDFDNSLKKTIQWFLQNRKWLNL